MTGEAWTFCIAWLVTLAALLVVLLGAASAKADADTRYLRLAARLLRSEQAREDLETDNATLRRKLIRLVGGRPVQSIPDAAARIASGMRAAREAASIDDEWAGLNGKDGA